MAGNSKRRPRGKGTGGLSRRPPTAREATYHHGGRHPRIPGRSAPSLPPKELQPSRSRRETSDPGECRYPGQPPPATGHGTRTTARAAPSLLLQPGQAARCAEDRCSPEEAGPVPARPPPLEEDGSRRHRGEAGGSGGREARGEGAWRGLEMTFRRRHYPLVQLICTFILPSSHFMEGLSSMINSIRLYYIPSFIKKKGGCDALGVDFGPQIKLMNWDDAFTWLHSDRLYDNYSSGMVTWAKDISSSFSYGA